VSVSAVWLVWNALRLHLCVAHLTRHYDNDNGNSLTLKSAESSPVEQQGPDPSLTPGRAPTQTPSQLSWYCLSPTPPLTRTMVLADLGQRLHGALSQLSRASVIDDKASVARHTSGLINADVVALQVIDALLKELCAALLESDVNVKLVSQLRAKVKAKVKKSLEEAEKAGGRELNKKNVVQKVSMEQATWRANDDPAITSRSGSSDRLGSGNCCKAFNNQGFDADAPCPGGV
jgi:signal recognition particle GTPase